MVLRTFRRPVSRSTSCQRRPRTSPRRMPVIAETKNAAPQPMTGHGVQELPDLLCRPRLYPVVAGRSDTGRIGSRRNVADDQPLAFGVPERLMQRGVDVANGLGG